MGGRLAGGYDGIQIGKRIRFPSGPLPPSSLADQPAARTPSLPGSPGWPSHRPLQRKWIACTGQTSGSPEWLRRLQNKSFRVMIVAQHRPATPQTSISKMPCHQIWDLAQNSLPTSRKDPANPVERAVGNPLIATISSSRNRAAPFSKTMRDAELSPTPESAGASSVDVRSNRAASDEILRSKTAFACWHAAQEIGDIGRASFLPTLGSSGAKTWSSHVTACTSRATQQILFYFLILSRHFACRLFCLRLWHRRPYSAGPERAKEDPAGWKYYGRGLLQAPHVAP